MSKFIGVLLLVALAVVLNLTTQHKSGILQGLVVEQPVKLRPLCRGVAVFVLNSDADKQNCDYATNFP